MRLIDADRARKTAAIDLVVHHIDRQPTIDAVPVKHGRWVWDENAMDWGLGGWVCGECYEKNDNIPAKPDIYPNGWAGSHFCPNCGVRMDGEDDG